MSAAAASSLTDQQHMAVYLRSASVVLSSGAGCGKTHVLTERYLAHLLHDGAQVGEIIAITFTERAARQMRSRIRQELVRRLRAASDDEAPTWVNHLRALETAPISTIHAFCGGLLRQHAVEAGLDAHFEVLEEILSVNLETDALNQCLQHLLTVQSEAGNDLHELVKLYGWARVVEGVRHLLRHWDERPWLAWLARSPDDLAAEWTTLARQLVLPRYLDFLRGGQPAVALCLALLQQYPAKPGPMADNVQLILERLPRLADAADLPAAVEEITEAAKVRSIGKKAWTDLAVYEPIRDALAKFRDELDKRLIQGFALSDDNLAGAVEVGRRLGRVVREVATTYAALKRSHGVVDFQDLIVLARDLLRDRETVRTRLQERYRFLLLDEAQDTDPVQMELIDLLCGTQRTTGKLFAVGDANQSIYRFRGADVSLFQRLHRDVPVEGRLGLSINFRSQPAILDFANVLVGHRLFAYEPLRAHYPQVNTGHCVEFLWAPRGDLSAPEGRALEADAIARRLAAMIGREKLVVERAGHAPTSPPELRLVNAGDVVLLFRSMSNVPVYEAALRKYGLDYYLVGGRAFFAQQEIYDLLNLLRALENPLDAVSLAGVLRSPFCCLSDEALYVLGRHTEGLWAGLTDADLESRLPADQIEPVQRARFHVQRWRGLKDRLTIARLLGAVFADSGYDAATQFEFLGDRKLANLWKLIDLARTFDRSGLFGLADFIARLGDLVKSQAREEQAATQPENADVVRLMSIHQAKGLEFPVVVVPDLLGDTGERGLPIARWDAELGCVARPPEEEGESLFSPLGWKLWQARNEYEEWSEALRILYVACTRARDFLILSSGVNEPFKPGNAWGLALMEHFDPQTGRCLVPDLPPERWPRVVDPAQLPAHVAARSRQPVILESSSPPPPNVQAPACAREFVSMEEFQDVGSRQGSLLPGLANDLEAAGSSWEERTMRAVLACWDLADPEGWRSALQAMAAGSEPTRLAVMEQALQTLAKSDAVRQLAGAAGCQRDVEYFYRLSGEKDQALPALRGRIDCLWQDSDGGWHLLFFTWRSGRRSAAAEKEWLPALTVAAVALHEQMGVWPKTVELLVLPDGNWVRRVGGRLPHRRVLDELRSRLTSRGSGRQG